MRGAYEYVQNMSKMIQVRNVPEDLHRILKARAATAGISLSDYLLEEFREIAERPRLPEFGNRLRPRERPFDLFFHPDFDIPGEFDEHPRAEQKSKSRERP